MKVKYLFTYIFLLVILFIIIGCGGYSNSSYYPVSARYQLHQYYQSYKQDKSLHKVIVLSNIRVVICGSKDNYDSCMARVMGWNGYYKINPKEIWVLGWRTAEGRIVVDETTLGHELQHLLHCKDVEIEDPDKKYNELMESK